MRFKTLSQPEKWIIAGIPIIFLIGAFFHILYDFSNQNPLIAVISPVNESVWEHTKMALIPVICWWTIYYLFKGREYNIDKNKWFTGALVALLTSIITIPMLFYFYTEAFGIESLAIDIAIFFIAILFGQLLGLHFYQYGKGINWLIVILLFIIIILIYAVFTYFPPILPLFQDSITGQYGIKTEY